MPKSKYHGIGPYAIARLRPSQASATSAARARAAAPAPTPLTSLALVVIVGTSLALGSAWLLIGSKQTVC